MKTKALKQYLKGRIKANDSISRDFHSDFQRTGDDVALKLADQFGQKRDGLLDVWYVLHYGRDRRTKEKV